MPSSYHRNYADSVSSIYRDMGRAKAEARLQQGQAWGNAIGNIGQTIAQIPGQMQAQKQQEQDSERQTLLNELTQAQLDQARAGIEASKQATAVAGLVPGLVKASTVNGTFNPQMFMQSALENGVPVDAISDVNKANADTAAAMAAGEDRIRKGQLDGLALAEAQKNAWRPIAMGIVERGFSPESIQTGFSVAEANRIPKETIEFYRNMDPDDFIAAVLSVVPRPKPMEPVNVAEGARNYQGVVDQFGQAVMGPDGQQQTRVLEGTPKAQTLEQQFAAATNGADRSRIAQRMKEEAGAKRAPEKATFEWAKLPDGAVRYMTPQEIRSIGATKAEAPRPSTEEERKAMGFVVQMGNAIALMDELETKLSDADLYKIQTLPQDALIGWANRKNTSEDAKRYLRALEQFAEAQLRSTSGAAIMDSEYARNRRTYAKQYGETPALASDRRYARTAALDALQVKAGSLRQPSASGGGVPEGTEQAIPGVPGGVARMTSGKWIRVK